MLYKRGWNGDETNFSGYGWGWSGSSTGMGGDRSETARGWMGIDIKSVGMGEISALVQASVVQATHVDNRWIMKVVLKKMVN